MEQDIIVALVSGQPSKTLENIFAQKYLSTISFHAIHINFQVVEFEAGAHRPGHSIYNSTSSWTDCLKSWKQDWLLNCTPNCWKCHLQSCSHFWYSITVYLNAGNEKHCSQRPVPDVIFLSILTNNNVALAFINVSIDKHSCRHSTRLRDSDNRVAYFLSQGSTPLKIISGPKEVLVSACPSNLFIHCTVNSDTG